MQFKLVTNHERAKKLSPEKDYVSPSSRSYRGAIRMRHQQQPTHHRQRLEEVVSARVSVVKGRRRRGNVREEKVTALNKRHKTFEELWCEDGGV
jgi:hypothetical protein